MKKVERPEDERAIVLAVPFDRRLPDVAKILHQHYNLLVQRNPGVKEWMRRAPMVAHLRPANLRDFLAGLHESLQPCSRAARKWRENEEMRRKWRENEEMERD